MKLIQRRIIGIICLAFGLTVPIKIQLSYADSINPGLYSIDAKPYGLTYGEWTAKWWQWSLSIPKDVNPAGDTSGKYCGQNQEGPVWFLAGTFGGSAERTCTIPVGKAIMIPPINTECSFAEYRNLKTESELRNCAKAIQDHTTQLEVTVDGVRIQNLESYRVQSPLFNVTFPDGNIFGLPSGTTKAVSDGNWVFLKPLSKGNHQIHSLGASMDLTTTATNTFTSDLTYNLTVG